MLTATGAVAIEALDPSDVDAGVAAHYGDPIREQRLLATAAGLVDRSNRGVLAVPGADRLTWLHDLTTQHVSGQASLFTKPGQFINEIAGESMWSIKSGSRSVAATVERVLHDCDFAR